jgi:uncharacterized protein DUF4352/uncharacterized protein DUF2510
MTTPPTPAGWYPDPDGSGGQRYWDGSTWTEHRAPAAPIFEPGPTPEPEASFEPETPADEKPTAVVSFPAVPTGQRVGAHRRPEPDDDPAPLPQPDSDPDTDPGSEPGRTEVISQPTMPVTYSAEPTRPEPSRPEPSAEPTRPEPTPFAAFTEPAPESEPMTFGAPSEPAPSGPRFETGDAPQDAGDNRQLIIRFGVACASLLAVLVVVVIYAAFIHKDNSIRVGAPSTPSPTPTSATEPASTTASQTESPTESPTEAPPSGQATDAGITFTVSGVQTAPSVQSAEAPVEKTAQGEFVIVNMTVLNSGEAPTTFLGTLQKLKAAGAVYDIDDEATFYLNGGLAELNPGDTADVGLAFDVPPGTVPETLEVHGDPVSPGVDIPLS